MAAPLFICAARPLRSLTMANTVNHLAIETVLVCAAAIDHDNFRFIACLLPSFTLRMVLAISSASLYVGIMMLIM